ncbi:MAG: putative zinc-binding metallopeptidase [Sulfuricurvum sp.]|nr:putative zinc-binding metallopeptidase [Sulfuricurvum sp.]MDD5387553.1 putative zinc-binding metallopeptidase [Sulfuricurvum sp.]
MKKWLIVLLLILGGMIFPTQALSDSQIESQVAQIYHDYGVRVLYKYDRDQYFGMKSKLPPVNAEGEQLSDEEILRILPIIREFLSVYSKDLIAKNLKVIYLTKKLFLFGKSFGASYGGTGLYIKSEGINKGFTNEFLLGTMHAEFSSILMKNYTFPEKAWKSKNPSNFQYVGNGRDMLGTGISYSQTPELLAKGLICEYAQASVEEDFNMMVYWLFTKPNELKALAKKYPIINSKLLLVIDFYQHAMNSQITL